MIEIMTARARFVISEPFQELGDGSKRPMTSDEYRKMHNYEIAQLHERLVTHTILELTASGKDLNRIYDKFTGIPKSDNPPMDSFTWHGDLARTIYSNILRGYKDDNGTFVILHPDDYIK